MCRGIILLWFVSVAALWPDGVNKKFQGFWLRHVDGQPFLSEITEERINEHECDGFSQLDSAEEYAKDCYGFADSGGDGYKACFQVKGKKLHMTSEARGKKFTIVYTRFSGTLADYKSKYCSAAAKKIKVRL